MTTRLLQAARAVSFAAALLLAPATFAAPGHSRAEPPSRRHWVPEFDPAAGGALIAPQVTMRWREPSVSTQP
jgi:hypothetical protein